MCGIAGIAGMSDRRILRKMCDIISHRGPNHAGYHLDKGISLGYRRLSIVDVKGGNQLISATMQCWASLFTARAIYYRIKNNFEHSKVSICVVVQKMVQSDKSGVMFSVNPVNNNANEIMIETGWGLGEAIVSGEVNPDQYIIDKRNEKVLSANVRKQTWMYVLDTNFGKTVKKDVPKNFLEVRKLSD